jgi:glycosyltransferase involved in cell wall biosynthesis
MLSAISFLVSVYNGEKIVRIYIESKDKAASKYQGKTDIALIDEGSTEQTRQIASEDILKFKYPRSKPKIFPILVEDSR